jgi:CHAT domain-containing protein
MSRLFFLLVSFLSIYNPLLAQSEAELLLKFDSLYDARNTAAANETGEKWKAVALQNGIQDTVKFVSRLIRIADGYRFLNQCPKGLETLKPGFKLVSSNTPVYPDLLKLYGFILLTIGDHWQADSILLRSKESYERLNLDHTVKYSSLLRCMADNQFGQGDLREALKWYEAAYAHRQKNNIPEDFSLGAIFSGLALSNQYQGNFTKASYWISRCIESYSKFLPPNHPSILSNKSMYVNFLLEGGQLARADSIGLEVLKDLEKGGYKSSEFYGAALESLAAIRARLGQDADAYNLLVDAGNNFEHTLGATHPNTIHNKLNQAKIRFGMGFIEEAQGIAETVKNKILGAENGNQMDLAETLSLLSDCAKNPAEAISLGEEALKICQTASGRPDCGILNQVPLKLALAYLKSGNYSKCSEMLEVVDQNASAASAKSLDHLRLVLYRAQMELLQGNWSAAFADLETFIKTRQEIVEDELFVLNEKEWLDQLRFLRSASDLLFTVAQENGGQNAHFIEKCLDFQIFNKTITLFAAQKVRENLLQDTILSPVFGQWRDTREQLAWCYTQSKEVLNSGQISIPKLEAEVDSLEQILVRSTAAFGTASVRNTPSWLDLQKRLQTGEAALEIVRFNEYHLEQSDVAHYAVMIITLEASQPIFLQLPPAEQLDQILIEKYLLECAALQGKGQTGNLYDAFWGKIEPYLKGISRVYVSADGAFLKINIGAIKLPDGQYVADRYDIRNVLSLKDIGLPKDPVKMQGSTKTAYLAGNPMFLLKGPGDVASVTLRSVSETPDSIAKIDPFEDLLRNADETRGLSLSPLPDSEHEVNDIAALLRKKDWKTIVTTGQSAKEGDVKSLQSPTVLHLATHGYFLANVRSGTAGLSRSVLENNPMLRSMIFFAGAQNTLDKKTLGKEDGILTAYEAQNLRLEGTELVVLSACQTAQGKIQNGEGVYGLQRALRIAGAKAVMLSLWDVDDKVGREFMITFYEKWLGGMGKQEAFRAAQLEVKKKHPLPFYWAGFVLIGE